MKFNKLTSLMVVAVALMGLSCDKPDLKSDKAKFSYAVGHQIGRNMKAQNIELDSKAFAAAVKDTIEGKEIRLSEEEMRQAMRAMSDQRREKEKADGEKNKKTGLEYLEKNKKKDGVKVTDSGLQYRVIKVGKGKKPKGKDVVSVHYRGTLIDGTEFDSSYSRNQPAEFPVNAVIKGWTEALQLMPVGSKWELVIPSELAYGERGNPRIPGNSVLVFEVELLDIVKK